MQRSSLRHSQHPSRRALQEERQLRHALPGPRRHPEESSSSGAVNRCLGHCHRSSSSLHSNNSLHSRPHRSRRPSHCCGLWARPLLQKRKQWREKCRGTRMLHRGPCYHQLHWQHQQQPARQQRPLQRCLLGHSRQWARLRFSRRGTCPVRQYVPVC